MRECGEEILVDISEILFNELAFFRLMQQLEDPQVQERLVSNKWRQDDEDDSDDGTSRRNCRSDMFNSI